MRPKRDVAAVKAILKQLEQNPMFVKGNRTGAILMPVSKVVGENMERSREKEGENPD